MQNTINNTFGNNSPSHQIPKIRDVQLQIGNKSSIGEYRRIAGLRTPRIYRRSHLRLQPLWGQLTRAHHGTENYNLWVPVKLCGGHESGVYVKAWPHNWFNGWQFRIIYTQFGRCLWVVREEFTNLFSCTTTASQTTPCELEKRRSGRNINSSTRRGFKKSRMRIAINAIIYNQAICVLANVWLPKIACLIGVRENGVMGREGGRGGEKILHDGKKLMVKLECLSRGGPWGWGGETIKCWRILWHSSIRFSHFLLFFFVLER